jgi:hypothetical protein
MATFILKNNSGSITAGQLEFNPESKSLALGDGSKVINIAKLNDVNSGSFNISGDLFVSGNANIVGNLTFGDNSGADTVTVVASLSSSLIPEGNNVHDLGSTTKYWKTGYITAITGSLSGSVNGIDITPFSASVSTSIGNLNNTSSNHENRILNLEQHSGSVNQFTASITASFNTTSGSLNVVSQSLLNVSTSYVATSQSLNLVSSSLLTFSASQYNADSTSFDSRLDLVEATASYLNTSFSTSVDSRLDLIEQTGSNHENRIHILELSQSAFDTAIELDSTNVTIYGNLTVQGTQTAIQSNILNVKDLNITIASGSTNSAAANGAGINIDGANVTMSWSDANQRIELNKDFAATGSISSSTINGIGNVTLYSASVDSRLVSLELTGSNFSTKIANLEQHSGSVNQFTASITSSFNTTSQSLNLVSASLFTFSASQYLADSSSVNNRLINVESTASYLNTTFSSSISNRTTLLEQTASYLNTTFSTSVDSRIDALENFSGSEYKNDSSSFDTRISASTLTFNDTTGQTGIDFTHNGTQVSAIASGLSTTSNVHFASVTASNSISASGTVYCDTLVASTLVGATLPVLEYETNGTLGNLLIKGATSKSIQVVDTITFTGMTQNGIDQYSATGLYMTGSITASLGFSGSVSGIGNVTLFSSSIDQRIKDATNEQYIAGFATTASLQIVSASAWGAFQSASSYSGSFYTTINNLSSSVYTFSSSIDSRVDTLEGTTHTHSNKANLDTINQNLGTTSTGVQFASLGVGTAPDATYEFKVAGDIAASGDIVAFNSSDERLKENIKQIENGLEKINKISGYEFDWNEDLQKARKGHDVGILAHEIEEILPEAVTRRDNGYLAVDYEKIIPLLIQSVKELSAKVKELENK